MRPTTEMRLRWRVSGDRAGEFIDNVIDRLHEASPFSKCFDEDTIRSILAEMIDGGDEDE